MSWRIRVTMQRTGVVFSPEAVTVEATAPNAAAAVGRIVASLMPLVGVEASQVVAEIRRARHPSVPSMPQDEDDRPPVETA